MFCNNCNQMKKYFRVFGLNKKFIDNCLNAYKILIALGFSGEVEFIAGNCSLEDLDNNSIVDLVEELTLLKHYFRCKKCGTIFELMLYCRSDEAICAIKNAVPGLDNGINNWGDIKGKYGTWQTKKEWESKIK